jgi:hypothetical protein
MPEFTRVEQAVFYQTGKEYGESHALKFCTMPPKLEQNHFAEPKQLTKSNS